MKRHTTLKRWLTVLAILFVPPFLVVGAMQALFWLLYRPFPSAPSFLAWLGIEGYAITVLGTHVLISAGLMGLLVRRWRRAGRWQFVLTGVAVPLAMPFLAFWPLSLLARLSHRLFPYISSTPWWFFGVEIYPFLSVWLLSDMTRYVTISLTALILTLAALIWLAAQEQRRVWRRGRFYLLLAACASVMAFPLLMRYRPVVKVAPGVELRLVDEPGLLGAGPMRRPSSTANGAAAVTRWAFGALATPSHPRLTTWTPMTSRPSTATWTHSRTRPVPHRAASCQRLPKESRSNRAITLANTKMPFSHLMAAGLPSPPNISMGRRTCSSYRASERCFSCPTEAESQYHEGDPKCRTVHLSPHLG
jgi:hypothetical protein